jgi:hypothetical protein
MNETRPANRQPVDPFDELTERERQILEGKRSKKDKRGII